MVDFSKHVKILRSLYNEHKKKGILDLVLNYAFFIQL